jgi:hypothetical protein
MATSRMAHAARATARELATASTSVTSAAPSPPSRGDEYDSRELAERVDHRHPRVETTADQQHAVARGQRRERDIDGEEQRQRQKRRFGEPSREPRAGRRQQHRGKQGCDDATGEDHELADEHDGAAGRETLGARVSSQPKQHDGFRG